MRVAVGKISQIDSEKLLWSSGAYWEVLRISEVIIDKPRSFYFFGLRKSTALDTGNRRKSALCVENMLKYAEVSEVKYRKGCLMKV